MKKGLRSLEDRETTEEVDASTLSSDAINSFVALRWVHVWKGFVKSRLWVRGHNKQHVPSLDDTYAPTPVIYVSRIRHIMALTRGWMTQFFCISIALLHAPLSPSGPIYVWPPSEFDPLG